MKGINKYLIDYIKGVSRQYGLDTLYDIGGNIKVSINSLNEFINNIVYCTNNRLSLDLIKYTREQNKDKLAELKSQILVLAMINNISVETIQLAMLTYEDDNKYISNINIEQSLNYYSQINIDRLSERTLDSNTIDKIRELSYTDAIKDLKIKENSLVLLDLRELDNKNIKIIEVLNKLTAKIFSQTLNKENVLVIVISNDELAPEDKFTELCFFEVNIGSKKRANFKKVHISLLNNNHKEIESIKELELNSLDF